MYESCIIINQYVTNHKDIVIETSKRVELKPKGKKKKKHQPKKTKQIRTIKIDTQKVKRIQQQQQQENLEKRSFSVPSSVVTYDFCRATGCLANGNCPDIEKGYYTEDNLPEVCQSH